MTVNELCNKLKEIDKENDLEVLVADDEGLQFDILNVALKTDPMFSDIQYVVIELAR